MKPSIPAALLLLLTVGCQKAPAQSASQSGTTAAPKAGSAQTPASTTPAPSKPPSQTPTTPTTPGAPGAPETPPAAAAVKPVPAQLPDVLARVNGEAITKAEFDRAVKNVESRAGQVPAEQRDRVYRGILDQLVAFHLLIQETKARNITVTDAEVDARIEQIRKQFPSEAEFTKALGTRNMTVDALKAEARSELAVQKLVDAEVKPKVNVQESAVKDFYDKNPQQFQQPETLRASHILIRVDPTATQAQKDAAKAKAEDLLKQIQGGADFAELAKKNSQDGSASNGGDLNYFARGQMVPEFDKAAAALQPGQVSGVVQTQFGYHIIKLTDRKPPRTVPLPEVSTRIGQFLSMQAQQQKAGEYLETLKAKSKIEILI